MQCPLLAHFLTQRCLFPGAFTAPKSLCLKASIIQLQGTLWACLPDYKQRGELRAKGMRPTTDRRGRAVENLLSSLDRNPLPEAGSGKCGLALAKLLVVGQAPGHSPQALSQ